MTPMPEGSRNAAKASIRGIDVKVATQKRAAPIVSLIAQCAIAVLLVLAVGTSMGRDSIDACLGLTRAG